MQETSTWELQDLAQLGGKGDPLAIARKIEFWTYYQMVFAKTRIRPRK